MRLYVDESGVITLSRKKRKDSLFFVLFKAKILIKQFVNFGKQKKIILNVIQIVAYQSQMRLKVPR